MILKKVTSLVLVVALSFLWSIPPSLAQQIQSTKKGEGDDSSLPFGKDVRSFGSTTQGIGLNPQSVPVSGIPATGPGDLNSIFYNIHVLGEVVRPGTYKVIPSDRVTDAIKYAGGFLPNGSQRFLQVRRGGVSTILDMYAYRYGGKLDQNPYLNENDVVFVGLKKGEIQIEGPVNRPGYYEISKKISLKQAIHMSGEFSVGVSPTEDIKIIRFDEAGQKKLIEVDVNDNTLKNFMIQKGDVVVIPHVLLTGHSFDYNLRRIPGDNIVYPTLNDNVFVIGAVSQPGSYPFQPHFTSKEYVGLAGPTNLASLKNVKVITVAGKKASARKVKTINPGDTIVVPSKAVTMNNFLMVFNTITNMILTTIAVKNNVD